ncbi:hypothetical protein MTO96_046518, partial [Rhipicephalus appendiculatus]
MVEVGTSRYARVTGSQTPSALRDRSTSPEPVLAAPDRDSPKPCWGGKVSDKQLVLLTDLTKKLEHGDEVMADRGFNVTEELAVLG